MYEKEAGEVLGPQSPESRFVTCPGGLKEGKGGVDPAVPFKVALGLLYKSGKGDGRMDARGHDWTREKGGGKS